MASYTIAATERAAYGKTLVASTVDTVSISRDADKVRVTNDTGTAAIFFRLDGTAPVVNGAFSYRVPASAGASLEVSVDGGGLTVVKLISSGTPTYSVEASL